MNKNNMIKFNITLILVGILLTGGLYILSVLNGQNCIENCTATGIIEFVLIIFVTIPLTLIGAILLISERIRDLFNKKKISNNISEKKNKYFSINFLITLLLILLTVPLLGFMLKLFSNLGAF